METMGSLRRTNYCGEVSMSNVGQEMTVCGCIAQVGKNNTAFVACTGDGTANGHLLANV